MTTATDAPRASAPWHLWVVGVLSLLWNGFGAYDYTMSHLQGHVYYQQMGMTAAQIAIMDAYPTYMHAVWAIGVWGSAVGSVLLLLRSRWALHAFALSTLGALGNAVYTVADPAVMEAMGVVMCAVILAVCLFLVWYSWTMTKRGVLR
jgi:hypothetical protein